MVTEICFATNNANKINEIAQLLPDSIQLLALKDINCQEELPETHETLADNSREKARYIYNNYHFNCFADDTGLEVPALNGAPGVYSARYAGPQKKPEDNINLLLKMLSDKEDRSAQFKTIITLILQGKEIQFEGIVKGRILEAPTGRQGFGYDPVFQPEGYNISFAEMEMAEKNTISHRGKAFRELVNYLKSL